MTERKPFLLRIDADLSAELSRWAGEDRRSLNGQILFLLKESLARAGRLPTSQGRRLREARREPVPSPNPGARAPARPSRPRVPRLREPARERVARPSPAPRPVHRRPAIETVPPRAPDSDWDAMVD
jgi:hypothetical protein